MIIQEKTNLITKNLIQYKYYKNKFRLIKKIVYIYKNIKLLEY